MVLSLNVMVRDTSCEIYIFLASSYYLSHSSPSLFSLLILYIYIRYINISGVSFVVSHAHYREIYCIQLKSTDILPVSNVRYIHLFQVWCTYTTAISVDKQAREEK